MISQITVLLNLHSRLNLQKISTKIEYTVIEAVLQNIYWYQFRSFIVFYLIQSICIFKPFGGCCSTKLFSQWKVIVTNITRLRPSLRLQIPNDMWFHFQMCRSGARSRYCKRKVYVFSCLRHRFPTMWFVPIWLNLSDITALSRSLYEIDKVWLLLTRRSSDECMHFDMFGSTLRHPWIKLLAYYDNGRSITVVAHTTMTHGKLWISNALICDKNMST